LKIDNEELFKIGYKKPKATVKQIITYYLFTYKDCTSRDIYKKTKTSKRAVNQALEDMWKNGTIKRTTCRCGHGHIYTMNS